MPSIRPEGSLLVFLSIVVAAALIVLAPLGAGGVAAQEAPLEADNTVTHIQLQTNGDAIWIVQIRIRLDTEQQLTDFEAFQEEFQSNTSRYLDPFRERIQGTVTRGANATGRQMSAEDFSASTTIQEVPRRWGVVSFRFTWVGFAEQQDGTLVVGDVFRGGYFLSASDSLEITVADGYEVAAVEPSPDERDGGVLTWRGREDFPDGRPRVVLSATAQPAEPRTTTAEGFLPGSGLNRGLLFGGILVVGLIVGGIYAIRRRSAAIDGGSTGPTASPSQTGTANDGTGMTEGEIKTDAERVRDVVNARGGRMKQSAIGDELDWSASKVSRVVNDMAERGSVRKLQLGRENVIELAEDE